MTGEVSVHRLAEGPARSIDASQRTAAKVAGWAFLLTDAPAITAQFLVRSNLIIDGNPAKTAANMLAAEWLFRLGIALQLVMIAGLIALIVALYVTLRPVSPGLAFLAAFWRVVENAVLAVGTVSSFNVLRLLGGAGGLRAFGGDRLQALALQSIGTYDDAYKVSLLFGGLGNALFAYLFIESGYLPRPLAAWGVFGALLTASSTLAVILFPNLAAVVYPWAYAPLLIFELGTALWLLTRGLPAGEG
jgi:Domain of unknown function (DUF4386)